LSCLFLKDLVGLRCLLGVEKWVLGISTVARAAPAQGGKR